MDNIRLSVCLIFFSLFVWPSSTQPGKKSFFRQGSTSSDESGRKPIYRQGSTSSDESVKKAVSRQGSIPSDQSIESLKTLEDVITEVILARKWEKKPFKPTYLNMQDFFLAINLPKSVCEHPTLNLRRNQTFYRLFYLLPYMKSLGQEPPVDLNVLRVWTEDQNFGDRIRIAIICDDIFTEHPDLAANYDNSIDQTFVDFTFQASSSAKRFPSLHSGKIGTRAAGLIAMSLDSRLCGIGIAPKAKIGAIRLIDAQGKVTLEKFASALNRISENPKARIDIVLNPYVQNYSKVESADQHFEREIMQAYEKSAVLGRRGKGLIHIVPVGGSSSKIRNPSCARNLHVNSIYTIAVAATEFDGRINEKSAACAAVMVSAFSTNKEDRYVMSTTEIDGGCVPSFKNSEAAASLVTGIVALVLKANPELSNRDVQHIIAWTSEVACFQDKVELWHLNKAGFYVSQLWGFGMINAYRMVQMAKTFESVPRMVTCVQPFQFRPTDDSLMTRDENGYDVFLLNTDGCYGTGNEVNYIEHIQLEVTLKNPQKGGVDIGLRSPKGIWIDLLKYEPSIDKPGNQMINWIFDSVMSWGERPRGKWSVRIHFHEEQGKLSAISAKVESIILHIHGTKNSPTHYRGIFSREYRTYMFPTPRDRLKPEEDDSCFSRIP